MQCFALFHLAKRSVTNRSLLIGFPIWGRSRIALQDTCFSYLFIFFTFSVWVFNMELTDLVQESVVIRFPSGYRNDFAISLATRFPPFFMGCFQMLFCSTGCLFFMRKRGIRSKVWPFCGSRAFGGKKIVTSL